MKYGFKSWEPWVISLMIDLMSKFFTRYAWKESFTNGSSIRGTVLKQEFARRYGLIWYYLLRSPMFDTLLKPQIAWFREKVGKIPYIGDALFGTPLDYYLALQQYFFYTEVS